MQAPDTPIDVLAIVPLDSTFEQIRKRAEDQGFLIQQQSTFKEGRAIIRREGYRYRIVLVDTTIADGVTDWVDSDATKYPWLIFALFSTGERAEKKQATLKTAAQGLESLVSPPAPNVIVNVTQGSPVSDNVLKTLLKARALLSDQPLPPYLAGDTRFLKEVGPLLFSVSRTDRPWALEGDVFTLPVGDDGKLGGVGIAWKTELGPGRFRALETSIKGKLSEEALGTKTPLYHYVPFGEAEDSPAKTRKLILATSGDTGDASVLTAVEACLATIVLATSVQGCRTLVLPVLGGGVVGLPSRDIIQGVLNEFDPITPLGELKHVIFTVYDTDIFDSLTVETESEIELIQKLENDIPSGPDRLSVESEVNALADAIALNQMTPPIVVGVLGGWGTGKSFILHLLKERLREIRCWDLTEKATREAFPYVGHPYLIKFDAWTYAKSDLWASLMQRILLDLDRQLSLERTLDKANPGLLLRGLDIWNLLDGLNDTQLEALETELGATAIARFKSWKKGENVAESLWGVLKEQKQEEVRQLDDAKENLEEAETEYARKVEEKTQALKGEAARQQRELEQALEKQRTDANIRIDQLQRTRDAARAAAEAEAEQEIAKEARHAAWQPAAQLLENFFGETARKILESDLRKGKDTPLSIYDVAKEIKLSTKYFRGLLHSKTGVAFVVFALLALLLPLVHEYLNLPELVATFIGTTGPLGGVLASAYTVLSKVNREFEAQQKQYDERVQKGVQERKARREELLQKKLVDTVDPIEKRLAQEKHSAKVNYEKLEADEQLKIEKGLAELREELKELKEQHKNRIEELKAEVEIHERRAGMVGRGDSLMDVVRERRANKFYDDKLGLLHQVQEDLKEVSDALIPIDGSNETLFPRGDPRVILLIDDLDRCSPDKVVQILEAAQLLVKTRLFVVVIAMDVRYVTRALEKEYAGILVRDGEPSGLDYIEKIVQIPYRVPGIAPGVMRSFLQGQMGDIIQTTVKEKVTVVPEDTGDTGPVGVTEEIGLETPVFEASYDPESEEPTEPLPTRVQLFDETELSLLADCCNAVSVSPRAGRRLVNVFKLLKIIWYHRGMHREPSAEVKRIMMFLLALSSVQPVIMRQVLHFLEEQYREGKVGDDFDRVLRACIDRAKLGEDHAEAKQMLLELINVPGNVPEKITLETMKLDNLRLVKSFSFVGEVSYDEKPYIGEPKPGQEPQSELSKPRKRRETKPKEPGGQGA